MTPTKLTKLLILGVIALVIVYDIVAYSIAGTDSTVSRVILAWATDIPIVVMFPGVLVGHFFWPQPCLKCRSISKSTGD